eukprot:1380318-Amorphochlora_amoeboformis.AAC.1
MSGGESGRGIWLPTGHYDVIVVGTSLPSCILSSALARAGKSVLHMDQNDYYGGSQATLTIPMLQSLMKQTSGYNTQTPERGHNDKSFSENKVDDETSLLENTLQKARQDTKSSGETAANPNAPPDKEPESEAGSKAPRFPPLGQYTFLQPPPNPTPFQGGSFVLERYTQTNTNTNANNTNTPTTPTTSNTTIRKPSENISPSTLIPSPTPNPSIAPTTDDKPVKDSGGALEGKRAVQKPATPTIPHSVREALRLLEVKKHRFSLDLDPRSAPHKVYVLYFTTCHIAVI